MLILCFKTTTSLLSIWALILQHISLWSLLIIKTLYSFHFDNKYIASSNSHLSSHTIFVHEAYLCLHCKNVLYNNYLQDDNESHHCNLSKRLLETVTSIRVTREKMAQLITSKKSSLSSWIYNNGSVSCTWIVLEWRFFLLFLWTFFSLSVGLHVRELKQNITSQFQQH